MRFVNIVLCLLMLLFIFVQFNDPDGLVWMLIYLVPATWAAIAAWRAGLLANGMARVGLWVSIAASAAGMLYFWPKTSGWWRSEVWWEVETAREGMGMMIVTIVLLVVLFSTRSKSHPGGSQQGESEQADPV